MAINYQVKILEIGEFAEESLVDNMLILFKTGAPEDVKDYCFVHSHSVLQRPIKIGDQLQLDNDIYDITAVGDVANENLEQLGHITLFFDNAEYAQFPGSVHLNGAVPRQLDVGSTLIFHSL